LLFRIENAEWCKSWETPYNEAKRGVFDNPTSTMLFPTPMAPQQFTLRKDVFSCDDVGIHSDAIYVDKY
jgi:hypothetical protein